jgi:hypothetical protein
LSRPAACAYGALGREGEDKIALTKIENKINNIQLIYRSLASGYICSIAEYAHNDFEKAVIQRYPVIRDVKGAVQL